MSLRFRGALSTTFEEASNRVYAWANRHFFASEWDAKRSRALIWERDERWEFREEDRFYWKRFTIRILRSDGGSRIHARALCRKWIPVAALAWVIGLMIGGLAGAVWDLVDQRGDLHWGRAGMMSLISLAANAFPFFVWRAQRREAAAQIGDLAASLADVLADPPDPPPATVGPYR